MHRAGKGNKTHQSPVLVVVVVVVSDQDHPVGAAVVHVRRLSWRLSQLCWVLYCDLMCLDYDGNLLDTCVIALLAALKNGETHTHTRTLLCLRRTTIFTFGTTTTQPYVSVTV